MSQRITGDAGQATVELLALVPVLAAFSLLLLCYLAGQGAKEGADQAAVAAAVAQLQGRDPAQAARAASPGWSRARVRVSRGRVVVRVEPRLPRFVATQIDSQRSVVFDAAAAGPAPATHRGAFGRGGGGGT